MGTPLIGEITNIFLVRKFNCLYDIVVGVKITGKKTIFWNTASQQVLIMIFFPVFS